MTHTRSSKTGAADAGSTRHTRSSKTPETRADQALEKTRKRAPKVTSKTRVRNSTVDQDVSPTPADENQIAAGSLPSNSPTTVTLQSRFRDEDIDPVLRNMGSSTQQSPPASGSQEENIDPALREVVPTLTPESTEPGMQQTQESPDASNAEPPKTKKAADAGYILGIMRGNTKLKYVCRPHCLPDRIKSAKEASRRYRRLIVEIVARAEALAAQTGCWIYVAGQHANATKAFTHYASPRLRAKAESELEELHSLVMRMMRSLIEARRRDTTEISLELEKERGKAKAACASAKAAEDQLAAKERELREKDELIASLRALNV
ncbi:hypothetical protein NP233_g12324 [Leucocoprinus birnbaumii]|uniref:Uncharacterized protein n=1 Tax=Leucocoprinus birnbaumii TaxID=56174 RepID=A0AAD5VEW0_9AGAR|nr:hypothetical protein NP233_g12324 [Leucocoprinus birnbaumii]